MKRLIGLSMCVWLGGCSLFSSPEETRLKQDLPAYGQAMVSSDAAFQHALKIVKGTGNEPDRVQVLEEDKAVQEGLFVRVERDPKSGGRDLFLVALNDRVQSIDAMIRSLQTGNTLTNEVASLYAKKDNYMMQEQTKRLNTILGTYGIKPVKNISGNLCVGGTKSC